jgi:ADP-heptose:LPS heptosyltransferase
VEDVTGRFSLEEFVGFLGSVDGLVACSTGPLHIASALGKVAIGIYPPYRPIHPGRWRPLGVNAHVITANGDESTPAKDWDHACLSNIVPSQVASLLQGLL